MFCISVYLVDCGANGAVVQDVADLFGIEVGQADGSNKALFNACLQCLPCHTVVYRLIDKLIIFIFWEET